MALAFLRTYNYLLTPTSNFAHEIIGNMLELEPYRWRKPPHVASMSQHVERFQALWAPFDWTREAA